MNIYTFTQLPEKEKLQISLIMEQCRSLHGLTLSFPFEDGDLFLIYKYENQVVSAMAFCEMEENVYECMAITAPSFRQKGCFTRLFEKAETLFPDGEFSFVTDGSCPAAKMAIESLGGQFWYDEHFMCLNLRDFQPPLSQNIVKNKTIPSLSFQVNILDQANLEFYAYIMPLHSDFNASSDFQNHRKQAASCRLSLLNNQVYFYALEVLRPFRRQGIGQALLNHVLFLLSTQNSEALPALFLSRDSVSLQVSGDNAPALALYKKTGFRVTETLSYYIC